MAQNRFCNPFGYTLFIYFLTMNRLILFILTSCIAINTVCAKEKPEKSETRPIVEYKTTIYTDKSLANELAQTEGKERGFGTDLLMAMGNAAIGVATGYVSSIIDLGIQALGQLIMLDRKHKQEWQEAVMKESTFSGQIGTLYELNDFYSTGSYAGSLDPTGIQFNGVGCLATVGPDTAFYISCHLNRHRLKRLRDHSKFELILDTLVINPYHAHLPNSPLPLPFYFSQRKTFDFKIKMQIISSWMDFIPSMHQNEVLGEFSLDVPVDSTDLNDRGMLVYIRNRNEPAKYDIMGESFIVPRSYMQSINPDNTVSDYYGTGQYSLNIMVEENCSVTPEYEKNWRKDRKFRQQLTTREHKKPTFDEVCKTLTHQTWDESLQAWVITILKAPVDYSIKTLNDLVKSPTEQQSMQSNSTIPSGKK